MDHAEIESLLGAYALDAVPPEEALEIEAHLRTCPRCQAELAALREVTALLGDGGSDAPDGLWEQIAARLEEAPPERAMEDVLSRLPAPVRHDRRRTLARAAGALLAAAAVTAVALLGLQVNHLDQQVHHDEGAGLAAAVTSALAAPHRTITLTSASGHSLAASVVTAPGGDGYWIDSDLRTLSPAQTYQVWALVQGRVVSVALLGPDAHRLAALRVEPGVTRLMVTAEPEGGAEAPTTPVLVQGPVQA